MVGVNTICRIFSAIHDNSERMPLKQQFSRSTFLADRDRDRDRLPTVRRSGRRRCYQAVTQ